MKRSSLVTIKKVLERARQLKAFDRNVACKYFVDNPTNISAKMDYDRIEEALAEVEAELAAYKKD